MQCSFRVILFIKKDVQKSFILSLEDVEGTLYLFIFVSDSQEIMKIIQSVKPDLFLVEGQLPCMTGLYIYDLLHATRRLKDVPALLLCENKLDDEMAQRIAKRQMHVQVKPYVLPELLDRIEAICVSS